MISVRVALGCVKKEKKERKNKGRSELERRESKKGRNKGGNQAH